jgi:hypothetical protein
MRNCEKIVEAGVGRRRKGHKKKWKAMLMMSANKCLPKVVCSFL